MSNKKLTGTLIPKDNKKAKMHATFYSDKPVGSGGDSEIFNEHIDATDAQRNTALANVSNQTANSTTGKMGYKVLDPTKTFTEQVTAENTIYEIRNVFDLNGNNVVIPINSIIKFNGGIIKNGNITGHNIVIDAPLVKIFDADVTIGATLNVKEVFVEWWGANGDGITDDTASIRKAIYTLNGTKVRLVFQNNKTYKITDTLNYYGSEYFDIDMIMCGSEEVNANATTYGILLTDKTKSIFGNANISGTIHGLRFLVDTNSHTTDTTSMFKSCNLRGLIFEYCFVYAFNSFLLGSKMNAISKVQDSRIRAFYFAKTLTEDGTTTRCSIIDSFIDRNYISGITDAASSYMNVDNVCFEFSGYNGSYIRNNFIDYYRVIYDPGDTGCDGNINSIGNHYQVFLYFYKNLEIASVNQPPSLTSIGDAFNWTDPNSSEQIISRFTKDTYIGMDDETYEIPTYILKVNNKIFITIKDCILEKNLGNIIFIREANVYLYSRIEFSCNESGEYLLYNNNVIPIARVQGTTDERAYKLSTVDATALKLDKHCIETVSALPTTLYKTSPTAGTYSKYVLGERVYFGNRIYTLRSLQRDSVQRFEWLVDDELHYQLTPSTITYNTVSSTGTLNIQYTLCFVKAGTSYNTITSLSIPESLRFIPITIYNYDSSAGDIIISALKYQGANVVLKPLQCCVFVPCSSTNNRVISVSTPNTMQVRGATTDRPTPLLSSSDAGFTYWDTTLSKMIAWNGTTWVNLDGTALS